MKSLKKIFLLFFISFSIVFIGCNTGSGEPEITETSYTIDDPNSPDVPKKPDGSTYPVGTQIQQKIVEYDNGNTTKDQTITEPDGTTTVFHEDYDMDKETTISNTTIQYVLSDTPEATDKVSEKIESKESMVPSKGACSDKTTTVVFYDGSREVITSKSEGFTGRVETITEKTETDGSYKKETFIKTESSDRTQAPYNINETIFEKNSSGQVTKDVKTVTDSQDPTGKSGIILQVTTTTNYSNGTKTGTEIDTYRYTGGDNDGSFIHEVKDSSGTTTLKEMEYNFKSSVHSTRGKIIFKEENGNYNAEIISGENFESGQSYTHSAFITTISFYETIINYKSSDKIEIVSIDGKNVNQEYNVVSSLSVSFGTKF